MNCEKINVENITFFQQKQLGAKLMASQQKIEERMKKWQDLRQAVASLKVSLLE